MLVLLHIRKLRHFELVSFPVTLALIVFACLTLVSAAMVVSMTRSRSSLVTLFVIVTLVEEAKAIAATDNFPKETALGGGHVLSVAGENDKVEDSESRLHDHVGNNVKI